MTRRGFSRFTQILIVVLLCALMSAAAFAQSDTPAAPAATEEPVAAPTAAPAALVTVTGTVTHGTAGSTVPADLNVSLRVIGPDMAETQLPAVFSPDGAFTVADVPVYPDHVYVATADYQDGVFSSDIVSGSDLAASPVLPVTIYEFTDDPSVIAIQGLQAQVAVALNELQVLELYGFTNSSDRAYRAADGASVRVTVPEGAQIFDMGSARFLISDDGRQMIDNAPVLPGEDHTVHVLFSLPYGGEATVRHPVDYPLLNGFEVVNSDSGLTIGGDDVVPLGGRDSGMAFGVSATIPAGGEVVFTVSGTPAPAAAATPTGPTEAEIAAAHAQPAPSIPPLSVVLMVLGGACVGVAVVLFIRDRRQPKAAPVAAPDARVNALVQQIAELDVAFQAGSINQEAYDTQRAALKAELLSLARDRAEE